MGGSTIEQVTFVRCVYSILCPLVPGALSGNKKLKRRTVVIQKELLVSYSIIIVAAILPPFSGRF